MSGEEVKSAGGENEVNRIHREIVDCDLHIERIKMKRSHLLQKLRDRQQPKNTNE